ncbi:6-phosphogluconolactonase-like [Saccoglossus kowalevskii]|uniref:6-phosphogluconolactonase n=1 Tax=Saccoglossus kowalevskii TaxID=10224 RepID=A0ABM0GS38_SACKO|nr:PREDICTED: 6-phosphogluconolactonase-like [Saccoglossus kowalevskii]
MPSERKVHILDEKDIPSQVCAFVADKSRHAIESRGQFNVGVSGGSVAKILSTGMPGLENIDWTKWKVFFCDERLVPFDHEDSTYKFFKKNMFNKVNIPSENIFPIDPSLSVEDAAKDYAKKVDKVPKENNLPVFDLLILGMGPDGHTCSLFPGHKLLQETEVAVAPISDSPKPPPCRVTLSFPVINATRCAMFVSTGAGKADILQKVLEGNDSAPLPAARVKPTNGELHWFLDTAAAAGLKAKY